MYKKANFIGIKKGYLTPIESYEKEINGKMVNFYLCDCDCGNKAMIRRNNLKRVESCGCYRNKMLAERSRTHGMSRSGFHVRWCLMKNRVLNKNSIDFKYYGEKGIEIDPSWHEFENFKNDMYEEYLIHVEKYGEKHTTLDRIDGDGNYEKNNCRWATMMVQNNNKKLCRKPFVAQNIKTGEKHYANSPAEIGHRLNINDCQIGSALRGKRKTTQGYTFKYIDEIPI